MTCSAAALPATGEGQFQNSFRLARGLAHGLFLEKHYRRVGAPPPGTGTGSFSSRYLARHVPLAQLTEVSGKHPCPGPRTPAELSLVKEVFTADLSGNGARR